MMLSKISTSDNRELYSPFVNNDAFQEPFSYLPGPAVTKISTSSLKNSNYQTPQLQEHNMDNKNSTISGKGR